MPQRLLHGGRRLLRPFNFRASDAARRRHAVQYIAEPDYLFSRLRQEFPEQFEQPVAPSIATTGQIGLFVDNGSDGVFANLRIVHGS